MKFVIDRFENEYAIVEIEDGTILEIDKKLLPIDAKESDILEVKILTEETLEKKTNLENKFHNLFK